METVILDLKQYLKKNVFPSKTVLVFPPFNGFRRFLIHKLIEDNFASAEVAAFSIGQDINRRIVVCYKGLVRTDQNKVTLGSTQKVIRYNMIEAEGQIRQKSSPTVGVYRPPAARIAENRQRAAETKTDLSKRSRVRRPDQQMYVPRPKRASFGEEQPRSRSSSRTSFENDSCDKRKSSSKHSVGETTSLEVNEALIRLSNEQDNEKSVTKIPSHSPDKNYIKTISYPKTNGSSPSSKKDNYVAEDDTNPEISLHMSSDCSNTSLNLSTKDPCKSISPNLKSNGTDNLKVEADNLKVINQLSTEVDIDVCKETATISKIIVDVPKKHKAVIDDKKTNYDVNMCIEVQDSKLDRIKDNVIENNSTDSCEHSENDRVYHDKQIFSNDFEVMETISLSSDSRDSGSTTSSDTRDNCSTDTSQEKEKSSDKMEIEQNHESRTTKSISQEKNVKNKTIPTSDVLIISDSSSSDDLNCTKEEESSMKVNVEASKIPVKEKVEKPPKRNKIVNPEDCDWESMYDDSGECLIPDLMEELTNSVGKVRVASAESDYRPYQSIEERSNDGECVIEIYDFPADFKTSDLINIFAAYRSKNFQIKWVDDTHALGVFPSPLMADEVLACTLPFVKTRPLRLGIPESRIKARNLILPPLPSMERPKTCTALARRLVSGALGLRLPTSSQDREKEKQVLKEAREKRRLEAKQREAAWDGTLTNSDCV